LAIIEWILLETKVSFCEVEYIYAKLREANYGVWGWPQETINSNKKKKKMAIIEWILLETKVSFCEVEY
jgi:hypothetical protein